MSKVKKLLGISCGTILAVVVGVGGGLWVRGNATPEYKIPEWKLPSPNAFDTLAEAKKLGVGKLGDISTSPTMHFDKTLGKSVPGKPQPLEGRKALLEKNQASLAKLREALREEYAVPMTLGNSASPPFMHFAEHRELARMLLFASRTYAELGQKDKAAECATDAMALGILVAHRSLLIGDLVGIACEAIGCRGLWELADGLDAKTAQATAIRLEALEMRRNPFKSVLLGERDYMLSNSFMAFKGNAWQVAEGYVGQSSAFEQALEIEESEPATLRKTKQLFAKTAMTAQLLWYTKKGIFAESGRYMEALAEQTALPYSPNRPAPLMPIDPLNSILMPIFDQAGQKDAAVRAETALLRIYLALRTYKLEKGNYPVTLAKLVTGGSLKSLPDDPFAPRFGQTFGYRRESGEKFTLWSRGPDGDDDDGRAIVPDDDHTPRSPRNVQSYDEGDIVARINTY